MKKSTQTTLIVVALLALLFVINGNKLFDITDSSFTHTVQWNDQTVTISSNAPVGFAHDQKSSRLIVQDSTPTAFHIRTETTGFPNLATGLILATFNNLKNYDKVEFDLVGGISGITCDVQQHACSQAEIGLRMSSDYDKYLSGGFINGGSGNIIQPGGTTHITLLPQQNIIVVGLTQLTDASESFSVRSFAQGGGSSDIQIINFKTVAKGMLPNMNTTVTATPAIVQATTNIAQSDVAQTLGTVTASQATQIINGTTPWWQSTWVIVALVIIIIVLGAGLIFKRR